VGRRKQQQQQLQRRSSRPLRLDVLALARARRPAPPGTAAQPRALAEHLCDQQDVRENAEPLRL
jgi:hypothetical protein